MAQTLSAEIIASGTELLLGDTVDTNSAYIAQKLRDLGVDVYFHTTVGDNARRLRSAIEIAAGRADLIIITGGLGPTVDDVTRDAVAAAVGRPLVFSPELLEEIAARFARFGRPMTENNRRQAFIPEGAVAISNPVGTAPAFRATLHGSTIIALPGVPREMHYLIEHEVIPHVRSIIGDAVIHTCVLHTAGLGESQVDSLIADLEEGANPTVGLSAQPGRTDVRITAKAGSLAEAEAMISVVRDEVRRRLAGHVYGQDSQRLGGAVAERLRRRGARLTIAESVSAGLIVQELLEADADVVVGHELIEWAGDAQEDDARALADGLRVRFPADYALVSLAADPDPDVSSARGRRAAIAIVGPDLHLVTHFDFGSHPGLFQPWVVNYSLFTLWRALDQD